MLYEQESKKNNIFYNFFFVNRSITGDIFTVRDTVSVVNNGCSFESIT